MIRNIKNILFVGILFYTIPVQVFAGKKDKKSKSEAETVESQPANNTIKTLTREANFINAMQAKLLGNLNEAVMRFNSIVKDDPNNYASYFQLAQIYLQLNELDKAEYAAQKALDLNPKDEWNYILLGQIKATKGDVDGAADVYKKLISVEPNDKELYFDWGMLLTRAERYSDAIDVYNQMIKKFGFSDDIYYEKISTYSKAEMYDEAIQDLNKWIEKDTANYIYNGFLGDIYEQAGQDEKAIDAYQKVLEKNPDNVLAIHSLSEIYAKEGDSTRQEQILSKAMQSDQMEIEDKFRLLLPLISPVEDSDSVVQQANKGFIIQLLDALSNKHPEDQDVLILSSETYFSLDEKDKAVSILENAVGKGNATHDIWVKYLSVLSDLSKFDTLYNEALKAIQEYPKDPTFNFFAGFSATLSKKYKEAQTAYQEGLKKEFENPGLKLQMWIGLGDVSSELKDYTTSDEAYEKALEIDPNNATVLNNYAFFLSVRNIELDRAEKMSKKSNILEEDNAAFQDTFAWIMYQKGNYKEALLWMEKAMKNAGDAPSAEMYDHYGDILLKLEDKEKAVKNWEKALEIEADRKETSEKILQYK